MSRTNENLSAAINKISPEDWCQDNGVDYRVTTGARGAQLQIRDCPRCGGSSWKVFLNAETGLGNCFHGSCVGQPGYNLFSFAQRYLNLSPRDTAEHITSYAKSLGWKPKQESRYVKPETPSTVELPDSVPIGRRNNIEYLNNRGIDGLTAERFGLRYCESGRYKYIDHNGNVNFQLYDERIIIPVRDKTGKLVTFQGRDVTGKAERKYLFPPGLAGTGRYLYNADGASGKRDLVMGEGVFDVFAIDMAFRDFGNVGAIGSFGKSFSAGKTTAEDQLYQLTMLRASGAKSLTIMWDSEPKTIVDACDAVEKIKRAIPLVKVAILPPGCDPNEVTAVQVRAAYAKAVEATKSNLVRLKITHRQHK